MHALAALMPQDSGAVLKSLAKFAIELCSAGSGGVSVIETGKDGVEMFRWRALAGQVEPYVGGTTPRDWSPCGECLRAGKAMLYSYPARYFTYFQKLDTPIVEGLVIPMYVDRIAVGTIWIISHEEQRRFNAEDVRIMTSLGDFAANALRLAVNGKCSEDRLSKSGAAREIVWAEYARRIARGEEWALTALLDETRSLIFSVVLRVLSFRADAEEATADVYAQVWKTAGMYDTRRGSVSSWLIRIARNRAIDLLRSRSARDRSEATLFLECSGAPHSQNGRAASQTLSHLYQALEALPAQQRRAIELAYFSGLTMETIAEKLGEPLGTVKTRIRMALMKLRRMFAAAA